MTSVEESRKPKEERKTIFFFFFLIFLNVRQSPPMGIQPRDVYRRDVSAKLWSRVTRLDGTLCYIITVCSYFGLLYERDL